MKISGFTFIRNGIDLGYPFIESIKSVLDLCDEFIVNVGDSYDGTLEAIQSIDSPKIKIIQSTWNEGHTQRGFVYSQQKTIAQYACTGDWLFYLEGDEVLNPKDLPRLRKVIEQAHETPEVEAISFDYHHFYGNCYTVAISPRWYRKEARIIKANLRTLSPDALYWCVMGKRNSIRGYPKALHSHVPIYHYGWVRTEESMNKKREQTDKYWGNTPAETIYANADPQALALFEGEHPEHMFASELFQGDNGKNELFRTNPDYKISKREKRHRAYMKLEKMFGLDLSKNHIIELDLEVKE